MCFGGSEFPGEVISFLKELQLRRQRLPTTLVLRLSSVTTTYINQALCFCKRPIVQANVATKMCFEDTVGEGRIKERNVLIV